MPRVSIIIPCYNQAGYLPEALDSVMAQTYPDWECIIVNDGSTDLTEDVALEWVSKDPRFLYFRKENGGVSEARNFGIKKSCGEYLLPLDADDRIGETYAGKAVGILDKYPEIGLVYSKAAYFGHAAGRWKIPPHSPERILFINTVFCAAFYRRRDYDSTRGYNSNMIVGYEDWDFWLSLVENGIKAYKIPEVLFYYRIHENSRNSALDEDSLLALHRQIIENHIELYRSKFKDPFIMVEYLRFRKGFTGKLWKDAIYVIKNLRPDIFMFFIQYMRHILIRN